MVHILTHAYKNNDYNDYFNKYNFELSDFQKYAIEGIVNRKNVLITAHTGSGKTLPAEFAIEHYANSTKKIIYTTPIKALSNQKYNDFKKKFPKEEYPNMSFGIMTGDVQKDTNASVIIMTTEIFNYLVVNKKYEKNNKSLFELNFDEIEYVVFDEVHYFNDLDRGGVYEEIFMTIPSNIGLLMLSATLDTPETFAGWIEKNHKNETYLIPTNFRVVPLTHYQYVTLQQSEIKNIKDKALQSEFKSIIDKPLFIKNTHKGFDMKNFDDQYGKIKKIKDYVSDKKILISPKFILNNLCNYLYENEMFPAICFVFSRKKTEEYALEIEKNLFEFDSKNTYTIRNRCKDILQQNDNTKKFINTNEFDVITRLLEKGVAMHHAGMHTIFKELIEILFNEGKIKLLFATETFSVGINAPNKTTIFTNFTKTCGKNGNTKRFIHPSEYTQMAGRAGRRGIDKEGFIIHLNNMFQLPLKNEYTNVINGNPQRLTSKFKITYNLVLKILDYNDDCVNYISNSMLQSEINTQIKYLIKEKNEINEKKIINKPKNDTQIELYIELKNKLDNCKNLNQKKKIQKKFDTIKNQFNEIEIIEYNNYQNLNKELKNIENEINNLENSIITDVSTITNILIENDFITKDKKLTSKGILASNIKIVNSLVLTDLLVETEYFKNLSSYEIIGLISCFLEIKIPENFKVITHCIQNKHINNENLHDTINKLINLNHKYKSENELSFELINYVIDWSYANDENECKLIIQNIKQSFNNNIGLGDYNNFILRINNIVEELLKVDHLEDNIEFISKLNLISELLLKYIVSNQSLHI